MKKMTLTNAIVGVLVGIGIILLACLVPLSELLHWILIIFGAITIVINAVNLFNKYENPTANIIASVVGIILGICMIVFPGTVMNIIIAVYLIILPLLKIYYYKLPMVQDDIIKIVVGILFLVFLPISVNIADEVMKIILIVIGALVILAAISDIVYICKFDKKSHNDKHVDYDFSDKK